MRVDLPEPDGPMIEASSPSLDVERDAAERAHSRVALSVLARDVTRRDDDARAFVVLAAVGGRGCYYVHCYLQRVKFDGHSRSRGAGLQGDQPSS